MLDLALAYYLGFGTAFGLWWYDDTEYTGDSPAERGVFAVLMAVFWLPFLALLYGLKLLSLVGRET